MSEEGMEDQNVLKQSWNNLRVSWAILPPADAKFCPKGGSGTEAISKGKELTAETMEAWRRRGDVLQKLHALVRSETEVTKWDYEEEMDDFEVEFELWLMLEPFEVGEEEEM
ncbi:hypothetical protein M422DRAFT_258306 [Sphaerobolus stellatus SS14]|uniref:Uncharacterized protein n=1 Tax=Sphaerobolus stellatus (strain SS14) TaxID=990650 RepID=A0A0C9VM29_SPHS4|nr:hypothetical protein M422DRAFT_258306 [Sphaerobolus stellatus SS14]